MRDFFSKPIVPALLILVVLGGSVFAFVRLTHKAPEMPPVIMKVAKPTSPVHTIIGTSSQGRKIESYTYGTGSTHLLFVGGMAGGYEWNSVVLAYTFLDYLNANPDAVPANLSVAVIPDLNPDGVYTVTGKEGRFTQADVSTSSKILAAGRPNANGIDLNRNFDCNWKPTSMWQNKVVSAGSAPFSEPESAAIRDFILARKPVAVVFWHSQAGGVFGSACNNGILPETTRIMNAYSRGSGYPAKESFDAYPITGDSEGWLASIGIPALTVELTTHETIEWDKNLGGVKALFEYFRPAPSQS